MRSRRGRPHRIPFGLLLIALGIAVGVAAYLVDRADEGSAGPPTTPGARVKVSPEETAAGMTGSASPSSSPEPKGRLLIHGTGDVSLDPSYIPAFRTKGCGWAWSGLHGLFEHDDLTIINQECPSTDDVAPLDKTFVFRCDPGALD